MGRKCYVPECTSGYASNADKVSIFSVPKDDYRLALWNEIISRKDRELSKKDYVCEKHFKPDDIMKEWSDALNIIPLRHPRLKIDAIPSIFPVSSKYMYQKKQKYRRNGKQINNKARRIRLTSSIDLPELIPKSALEIIYIKEEIDSPELILDSSIAESLEIIVSEETKQQLENCISNEDPLEMLISKNNNDENVVKHNNQNNRYLLPIAPNDNQKSSVVTLDTIEEPNGSLDTLNLNRGETDSENLKIPGEQIKTNFEPKSSFDSVSFTSLKISNSKDIQNEPSLEIVNSKEDGGQRQKIMNLSEKPDEILNIFDTIWTGTLKPPNEFWSFVRIENKDKYISFSKFILSEKCLPIAERQVLVKKDLTTKYILNNIVLLDILPDVIRSVDELEQILISINEFKICMGGPNTEKYPPDLFRKYSRKKYVDTFSNVWRHSECKLIILEDDRSNRCIFCIIVQKSLASINKRIQLKKDSGTIDSKNSNRNKTKCIKRLRIKVEKLKNHIKEIKQKMSEIDKKSIAEKLNAMNVPKTQQLLIMQCIDQSKLNNPKQMRFHKNWLQISLLIYQKNRGMYRFLQETGILPLPCRRTMHRYLNGTNIKSRED